MRLFIDCEWNGPGGELISVALVPANGGNEFYQELHISKPFDPWVADNVVPHLRGIQRDYKAVQWYLQNYLDQFDSVHIVADWPEDIERFCRLLITGPGQRLDTPPLTMEVVRVDAPSELPHNALADARGIRDFMAANAQAHAPREGDSYER